MSAKTDRIEKRMVLRAPRSRVWNAIADSSAFGAWFQISFSTPFLAGSPTFGRITTSGYEHLTVEMHIERIEPQRLFSYRWHPYAVEPGRDYSGEPMTLVEFQLEETAEGTLLTIVESGFDHIPAERRAEAFRVNDGGWTEQARRIERYVTTA
jgi:uncharacterized protein YndB with AHSA1/START domain